MGYTHYYGFTCTESKVDDKRFDEALELTKKCIDKCPKTITVDVWNHDKGEYETKELPFVLKGGLGEGNAEFTTKRIWFNGDAEHELDYETFLLDKECQSEFCKTARKPYDLAVCLCLLSFKEIFGDDFKYSSDGITRELVEKVKNGEREWRKEWGECKPEDEWQRAYDIFDEVVKEL